MNYCLSDFPPTHTHVGADILLMIIVKRTIISLLFQEMNRGFPLYIVILLRIYIIAMKREAILDKILFSPFQWKRSWPIILFLKDTIFLKEKSAASVETSHINCNYFNDQLQQPQWTGPFGTPNWAFRCWKWCTVCMVCQFGVCHVAYVPKLGRIFNSTVAPDSVDGVTSDRQLVSIISFLEQESYLLCYSSSNTRLFPK